MSRKQDFDPLGGFVGGGSDRHLRKSKKSFDMLGSGKYGDTNSIYDEGDYDPTPVTGTSDALLSTGYEESKEKPQKHGFFSGLFRKKEKPQQVQPKKVQDPGFDSRNYGLEIKDGVMDTGLIDRYKEEENAPLFDDEPEPVKEEVPVVPAYEEIPPESYDNEDLFGEDEPAVEAPFIEKPVEPVPVIEDKPAVHLNPHVCHLCGSVSRTDLPEFGFGSAGKVPLCRNCTRAATILMKHTDPSEEAEIFSEWSTVCPGLDTVRAKELVNAGRKSQ